MVKRLRELRQAKGISQQQLADELDISQQSINKYENHKVEPDIYMLMQMADFFETSVDYLVGHTDVRHKIEPVEPCDLNAEELSVIEKYRLLAPKQRASVRLILESYLE